MAKLTWDSVGDRRYETGLDRGVLYVKFVPGGGVPWSGLVAVTENADGGAVTGYYIDGRKYVDDVGREDYKATLEAFTYPEEFGLCEGYHDLTPGLVATGQHHRMFGLSYRTKIGNDVDGVDHGYKIHLIYNATAATASRNFKTMGESIDPDTFSWDLQASPPYAKTYRPTAHFIVDSRTVPASSLAVLESMLYGTDTDEAYLPEQDVVIALLGGDVAPPVAIYILDGGTSTVSPPNIVDGGSGMIGGAPDLFDGGTANSPSPSDGGPIDPVFPDTGGLDGGSAASPGSGSIG